MVKKKVDMEDENVFDPTEVKPEPAAKQPKEDKVNFTVEHNAEVTVTMGNTPAKTFHPEKSYYCTEAEWQTFYKHVEVEGKPVFKEI